MPRAAYLTAITVLLCCLSGSCKEETKPADKSSANEPTVSDINRLRSLGYVGFSRTPADMSKRGVVAFDRQRSYSGYNLCSFHTLCLAELTDNTGKVVRSWKQAGDGGWANCELLPDGDLLAVGSDPFAGHEIDIPDESRYLMRFSWDGDVVWKRKIIAHHDVTSAPDDHILTLTSVTKVVPEVHPTAETCYDQLTLLTRDGEAVAHCSLWDALHTDPRIFIFQRINPHPQKGKFIVDLLHSNSVEWMHNPRLESRHPIYGRDAILVAIRHQDTVAIINRKTKRVIWSWGRGEISGPHDATALENGHILLFDNGLTQERSRVIELDPLTKKIVWEYKAPNPKDFFSFTRGAAQRLPNGNTLITNSDNGHVFEVTAGGEIVWQYLSPHFNDQGQRATIVRMKRYKREYVEGIQKRLQASGLRGGP
jgi:hypothetical protein